MDARRGKGAAAIDIVGLITLVAGLTAIVVALMQASDWGWTAAPTLALLAAGAVVLVVFVVVEVRKRRPLIDLPLLTIPAVAGGNVVFFAFQFDKIVVFVFVALFLQDKMGMSPFEAGLTIVTAVVPAFFASPFAGKAVDRFGSRPSLLIAITVNGLALLAFAVGMTVESYAAIVAAMVVWGAAIPSFAVAARRAIMNAVPTEEQGQASGVNLTVQMLGGTIGMALASALLLVTGSFPLVFVMTAGVAFIAVVGVWLTIDHRVPVKAPA